MPEILPLYCCVTGRGAAVGNTFGEVGIEVSGSGGEAVVESVGLLVGAGAIVGGVDWAAASWGDGVALVVSPCWLHPHTDKLTSALAAAIWIFRIDLIFFISFFTWTFALYPHRRPLLGCGAVGP